MTEHTTVKTFDDQEVKDAIKKAPKILQQYIKAQEAIIRMTRATRTECLKKIKYQWAEIDRLKAKVGFEDE